MLVIVINAERLMHRIPSALSHHLLQLRESPTRQVGTGVSKLLSSHLPVLQGIWRQMNLLRG